MNFDVAEYFVLGTKIGRSQRLTTAYTLKVHLLPLVEKLSEVVEARPLSPASTSKCCQKTIALLRDSWM